MSEILNVIANLMLNSEIYNKVMYCYNLLKRLNNNNLSFECFDYVAFNYRL